MATAAEGLELTAGVKRPLKALERGREGPEALLDDRVDPAVFEGLRALGHHVVAGEKTPCSFNFAQPNGIAVGADGALHGGADPSTPAAAVGIGA